MFDWVLNTPFQSTYYNLSFVNPLMSGGKNDYKYLKKPAASTYDLLLPPDVKGLKLLFTFTSRLPQVKKFYRKTSCPQAFERSTKIKQNVVFKAQLPKEANDHKPPQTNTNHQQTTTNYHKPPSNDHKIPQITPHHQKMTANHQQTTTNHQQTTTNDQANLFRIPIIQFFRKLETRRSLADVNKHRRLTSLCNLIQTYVTLYRHM